jgi:hypothetical protein
MNVDPEDTWLAIGAGISVSLFGICVFGAIIRQYFCRRPTIKESRSDNDLANMLEHGESS